MDFIGCKGATYCSSDHQKQHWKLHKNSCRPFKVFLLEKFCKVLLL